MNAAATARALRAIDRPVLAALLEREGDIPVADYAAALHGHRPDRPLEPALAAAFRRELARVDLSPAEQEAAFARIERRRVMQTTTHVTLCEGPVFFASHYVASLGLEPDEPYIVAAFSGISFANSARPGCLDFARVAASDLFDPESAEGRRWTRAEADRARDTPERRLSLIPASQQSALVYGATVDAATVERVAALRGPIRDVLPVPLAGQPFTAWAGQAHRALHGRVLGRNAVTLDINEVLSDYLLAVLDDGAHPLHRLLFDPASRGLVLGQLPTPLFSMRIVVRGRAELEPLRLAGDQLRGPRRAIPLQPAAIRAGLAERTLCPGTFLELASLAFLNDASCLGGVDQLEYLDLYRRAWLGDPGLPPLSPAPLDRLASGRFVDQGVPVLPLDLLYGAARFEPHPEQSLLAFLQHQFVRLLGRPFKIRPGA
jgi:hypothetical protein